MHLGSRYPHAASQTTVLHSANAVLLFIDGDAVLTVKYFFNLAIYRDVRYVDAIVTTRDQIVLSYSEPWLRTWPFSPPSYDF
jgi:hypothetical protein